jgi:hypothetical protein
MREFLFKQVVPRAIGITLEEGQLEVVAFFAASLGTAQIATHNALLNIFFVITSAMYGLTKATRFVFQPCRNCSVATQHICAITRVYACTVALLVKCFSKIRLRYASDSVTVAFSLVDPSVRIGFHLGRSDIDSSMNVVRISSLFAVFLAVIVGKHFTLSMHGPVCPDV